MPFADKEKQKAYMRDHAKKDRELLKKLKNTPVSGKLKRGDKVEIYNTTEGGKEFLEGTAILEQKLFPERFAEYWRVRFDDGADVLRWVRAENKIKTEQKRG